MSTKKYLLVIIISILLIGCNRNIKTVQTENSTACENQNIDSSKSQKIQSYFSGNCFQIDQEFYEDVTADDENETLYLVVSDDCTTCRIKYLFIFDKENLIKTLELDEPENFSFQKKEITVSEPVRLPIESESSPTTRKTNRYSI